MEGVKDLILIISFCIMSISFLGNLAVAVFGKPKSTEDLQYRINELLDRLNSLMILITTSNNHIEELQKEIKAMWGKIGFLTELGIKNDRQIAFLKGRTKSKTASEDDDEDDI